MQVPIPLQVMKIPIRRVKPVRIIEVWWPMLKIHDWLSYLLQHKSPVVLGGGTIHEPLSWQPTFTKFWQTYQAINPGHDVYGLEADAWGNVIPLFIHGDEGRGLQKQPWMVLAWQPVISHRGIRETNDSSKPGYIGFSLGCHVRHSFTTRFLFSCISASLYSGDSTLQALLQEMTDQIMDLFSNGITVPWFELRPFPLLVPCRLR